MGHSTSPVYNSIQCWVTLSHYGSAVICPVMWCSQYHKTTCSIALWQWFVKAFCIENQIYFWNCHQTGLCFSGTSYIGHFYTFRNSPSDVWRLLSCFSLASLFKTTSTQFYHPCSILICFWPNTILVILSGQCPL